MRASDLCLMTKGDKGASVALPHSPVLMLGMLEICRRSRVWYAGSNQKLQATRDETATMPSSAVRPGACDGARATGWHTHRDHRFLVRVVDHLSGSTRQLTTAHSWLVSAVVLVVLPANLPHRRNAVLGCGQGKSGSERLSDSTHQRVSFVPLSQGNLEKRSRWGMLTATSGTLCAGYRKSRWTSRRRRKG